MKSSNIFKSVFFYCIAAILLISNGCDSQNNPLIGSWEKIETIYSNGNKMESDKKVVTEYTAEGVQYIYLDDKLVKEATSKYSIKDDTVSITLEFDLGIKKIRNTEKIYFEISNDTLMFNLSDGQISYYKRLNKK